MTNTTKYYVTMVRDCAACDGSGKTPEGMDCGSCDGSGAFDDAVELAEALAALGILPRLEQVEKTASRAMYYADVLANGGI